MDLEPSWDAKPNKNPCKQASENDAKTKGTKIANRTAKWPTPPIGGGAQSPGKGVWGGGKSLPEEVKGCYKTNSLNHLSPECENRKNKINPRETIFSAPHRAGLGTLGLIRFYHV